MRSSALFAHHCRVGSALGLACMLTLTFAVSPASADERALERVIRVSGNDRCPTAAAIAAVTWQLTPPERRTLLDDLVEVLVDHREGQYRVVVATKDRTTERVFTQPERDCGKRARYAAVFVVLILTPRDDSDSVPAVPDATLLELKAAPAPAFSAPISPVAPAVKELTLAAPPAPSYGWGRVEVSGALQHGFPVASAPAKIGSAARVALLIGRARFVPGLQLSYAPPAALDLADVQATLTRASAWLGVRARGHLDALEWGVELGGLAEFARVVGSSPARPASDGGVQLGVRGAVLAAWPRASVVQPFVSFDVSWYPWPRDLLAVPRGVFGSLPSVWLGASAGLALAP